MRGSRWCCASAAMALIACGALTPASHGQFTPGDIFAKDNDGDIYNITAGGDVTGGPKFSDVGPGASMGKAAWTPDLSTMIVSEFDSGTVYLVGPTGFADVFAIGLSGPTSIILTTGGRLLVTEVTTGEVTDITAGGVFTSVAPFAAGLSAPRDIVQMGDGRILVAEDDAGEISDVTGGGTIGAGQVFVSGIGSPSSMVVAPSGGLMVADLDTDSVFSVDALGVKTTFGTNRELRGIAYTSDGRLLGAGSGSVFDISAGGDMSTAPVFASGLFGINSVSVVATVPEPASLALAALACLSLARRRSAAQRPV